MVAMLETKKEKPLVKMLYGYILVYLLQLLYINIHKRKNAKIYLKKKLTAYKIIDK